MGDWHFRWISLQPHLRISRPMFFGRWSFQNHLTISEAGGSYGKPWRLKPTLTKPSMLLPKKWEENQESYSILVCSFYIIPHPHFNKVVVFFVRSWFPSEHVFFLELLGTPFPHLGLSWNWHCTTAAVFPLKTLGCPEDQTQVLCGLNFFFEVLPLFSELNGRVTRPTVGPVKEGEVRCQRLKRQQDTSGYILVQWRWWTNMKDDNLLLWKLKETHGWKRWRWFYWCFLVTLSLVVILTLLKVPTMI